MAAEHPHFVNIVLLKHSRPSLLTSHGYLCTAAELSDCSRAQVMFSAWWSSTEVYCLLVGMHTSQSQYLPEPSISSVL